MFMNWNFLNLCTNFIITNYLIFFVSTLQKLIPYDYKTRLCSASAYFLPRGNKKFTKNQSLYKGTKLRSELNSNIKSSYWNAFKKNLSSF